MGSGLAITHYRRKREERGEHVGFIDHSGVAGIHQYQP